METLTLILWIILAVVIVGSLFRFLKQKNKKPVEKEIFSAPLDAEEPKVKPEMPEMPKNDEGVEEAEEEGDKEE